MGVYIPNMKFPQNCDECDLLYDCCACGVTHKRMDFETMDRARNPHCPLVPVPPHGDLIDRDAARGCIKPWSPEDERSGCTFDTVKKLMHTMLSRAPTIIPAEEAQP